MVSNRRYALMVGWARYLHAFIDNISRDMKQIEMLRGTPIGIAVHDDYNALRWQRLDFRKHRAAYAVGAFGIKYKSIFTDWKHASREEVAETNRKAIAKYRLRAQRAKKILLRHSLAPCSECQGAGYFIIGDREYACDNCQIRGIVILEESAA